MRRGSSIDNNAVVAGFLRTLEYFDGLIFMTTNRPDDIDDAILSRCAAIISFEPPQRQDARRIWEVLAKNFDTDLSSQVIDAALDMFPQATGRDIKKLLALCLQVARKRGTVVDAEMLRQFSLFRGMTPCALPSA